MNRARAKKEKKQETDSSKIYFKKALLSLAVSVGIGGLLIFVAALVASLTPDPGKWIRPLAIPAASLTYLLAGIIAASIRRDAPLAAGSANGLLLSALSLVLSLLFRTGDYAMPAWMVALLHSVMILLSLLGAYLFVWKSKTPKAKKRKKHK